MDNFMKKILCLFVFLLSNFANAGLVFDNSQSGKLTVSWDIDYTLTADPGSDYVFLTFKNIWDTADGPSYWWAGDVISMANTLSVNGNAPTSATIWLGWQFRGEDEGGTYNNKDFVAGTVSLDALGLSIGDILSFTGSMTVDTLNPIRRMPDNFGITTSYLARGNSIFSDTVTTNVSGDTATPTVPAPASMALVVLGFAAISLSRKRK